MRMQLKQMETLLPTFQALCEKQLKKQPHKIIAGLDETFFGEFIILVLMDLRSGYLLLEEVSDDRCFDTWYEKTTPQLESLGLEVNHVVSDLARALKELESARKQEKKATKKTVGFKLFNHKFKRINAEKELEKAATHLRRDIRLQFIRLEYNSFSYCCFGNS